MLWWCDGRRLSHPGGPVSPIDGGSLGMNVLALDSASAACSVALWCDEALRAHRFTAMARGHAEALMPMVEAVMAEARLAYADLDLIATTVGPGTFTGLRVGLATARGLALAADLPIAGVTTFEALVHGIERTQRDGRAVAAAFDARRGAVYLQTFAADLAPLAPPQVLAPAAAAAALPAGPVVLAGDGAALVAAALGDSRGDMAIAEAPRLPAAVAVAELCARRFARDGAALPRRPPAPLYLRPPGARLPAPAKPRGGGA